MSKKNLDQKGRWRSMTVAFHVSPEENESINAAVRLSGMTKQEYITKRLLDREIVVNGNPKVYLALKKEMTKICAELERIETKDGVDSDLCELIELIARTMDGLKKERKRE